MSPHPRLNGNFSRLGAIIESGEEVAQIQPSFPTEGLLRRDNIVSLRYDFGLLSFAGERQGRPLLKVPNRTVRQLMSGYRRDAYDAAGVFRPSTYEIADRLNHMAKKVTINNFPPFAKGGQTTSPPFPKGG
ncbi:hypothetical protein G3480_25720 [Thiorhodococcus mannitoliphagus]|uniref:Uncharacterized protein n=1 Tax=Thiorhodococcus mannitoliphagus TaxID=329406 RepID=A0A6P1E377_9GAMM|nr:hypothetical protein [Thiorhodococcus mannitoliphagus]NEX23633.1 hypothetical protein [Thiorhodococcus mannitoliphagus]